MSKHHKPILLIQGIVNECRTLPQVEDSYMKTNKFMDALARTRRGCCQMEDFSTYSITPYVKILIP